MITNKDVRVENGNLILNGDKYPLDGQSPEAIMQIVEDNSDTTPTENSNNPVKSGGIYSKIGDLTQTGLTGDSVAEQLATASGDISSINTALNTKLTLVERKETSSGSILTFDTPIQSDKMYLIAMTAPLTQTARPMKCSMIRVVDTTTNEISFGSSDFVVTVSNLIVTITNSKILYGMRASLVMLE